MRAEEFTGVNFHTTVPYSLVTPTAEAPFPGGPKGIPIPNTLEEALLDNTSAVNIMLKCRQDVHDALCDFTRVEPFPVPSVKSELEKDDSSSDSDDDDLTYLIQR